MKTRQRKQIGKGKGKTGKSETVECDAGSRVIVIGGGSFVCFPEVSRACSLYVKTRTILPKYVKMFTKYVNCRSRHDLENFT